MPDAEYYKEIICNSGTIYLIISTLTTVTISVIVFVARSLFKQLLDKDTERLKILLEAEKEKAIIKFTNLHQERADAIKEIYKKLSNVYLNLESTINIIQYEGEPSLIDKIKLLKQVHNDFLDYYYSHKILFPEDTCTTIEKMQKKIKTLVLEITTYPVDINDIEFRHNRELILERKQAWDTARKELKPEIDTLKDTLETIFRNMLGVND